MKLRALLLVLVGIAWLQVPAQSRIEELDRIVAIVNEDVIVWSELEERIREVRSQLTSSGTSPPPYHVLQKQVLERLIIERLQLQVADRTGIRVDDNALNAAIADMAQKNNLSLRDFRDILRRDGYDFAEFREQVRDQMRIAQVRQRNVGDRIVVSERDVDNFLANQSNRSAPDREYHIAHILVALPEGASAEEIAQAKQRAEGIVARLRGGGDFAQTAVAMSDGQQALSGGDLGWKKTAELPTIFVPVIPNLGIGEVSDPIRSPSGFHIIKVLETRGNDQYIVNQTLARHILIRPNELISDDDARIRLEQLRARVLGGEDFGELARSHSDDRGSAIKGGELGWLNPGSLIPRFEEVSDSLAPGEISEPFKTQFGWHIVQVMDRREHDNTEDIVRVKAREQIRERKLEEEGQGWLRQIRDSAYVEYRLDE